MREFSEKKNRQITGTKFKSELTYVYATLSAAFQKINKKKLTLQEPNSYGGLQLDPNKSHTHLFTFVMPFKV